MNPCGDCHACCILLPIAALTKPAGLPCSYLHTDGPNPGCGVYRVRPGCCASFRCWWLAESSDPDLRPDRAGVMLTHSPSEAGLTITVWELRPGVLREAMDLWRKRAEQEPIALHFHGGPSILLGRDGREHRIAQPF